MGDTHLGFGRFLRMSVLNPIELPSREVQMGRLGVLKQERLCDHFGKDLKIDKKKFIL